jgi:dTDP-4-dehydrorhamnose 3,5-epimerase
MPFIKTDFPGLCVFEPLVFSDERGFFFESYNERVFQEQGLDTSFIQDNQSFSKYGVIRGLHFQLEPHGQSKLVRVLKGTILDAVVDLRKGSPKYGQCMRIELSEENKKQLFIPKGFAHGFSVLSPTAEILYKCDSFYHRESESGIRFDDSTLNIDWQVPKNKQIVSSKDLQLKGFEHSKSNFGFNPEQ